LGAIGVLILAVSEAGFMGDKAHRDDHYMFVLQENGTFEWEVDFNSIRLSGPAVSFIAPGQVHRYLDYQNSQGWLIFVDTSLVSKQLRDTLYTYLHAGQAAAVEPGNWIFKLLPTIVELMSQSSIPLYKALVSSCIETFIVFVASRLLQSQPSVITFGGPKHRTVIRFKKLITENFKELRTVRAYADLLNITPLYLNEIVKEATGFTASYWIDQEVLLEAKRLLSYTVQDVKQIAYELGYDDHTYFSRFFKKHTRVTALEFRKMNHGLSNDYH
jgi:AraC-like DNA-binding protein